MALGRTTKLNTGAEIPLVGLGKDRDGTEIKERNASYILSLILWRINIKELGLQRKMKSKMLQNMVGMSAYYTWST
jgi:hypothetical protein